MKETKTDLTTLDQFVGCYVCTERPRTPLEIKAYGEPGLEGGCGWVTEIEDAMDLTLKYAGEVEVIHGRWLFVDHGYGFFITETTTVTEREPMP